jgi:hypothetical protein
LPDDMEVVAVKVHRVASCASYAGALQYSTNGTRPRTRVL